MIQKNKKLFCDVTSCVSNKNNICAIFTSVLFDGANKDGKNCSGFKGKESLPFLGASEKMNVIFLTVSDSEILAEATKNLNGSINK